MNQDMVQKTPSPLLMVQPLYTHGPEWEELAARHHLFYEPLELSMSGVNGKGTVFLEGLTWYRESKRVRSLHGVFIDINPASGDEIIRRISRERSRESCRTAQELGAERVIFHSSMLPQMRGGYFENWVCSCADFYAELADQYPSLTICIENCLDMDPEPITSLIAQAAHPRIGVCLDLGHINYSLTPMKDWFLALGGAIQEIHLSDNRGRYDEHLPLGDGTVDWVEADSLYRRLGRRIPLTFEVGGLDGVKKSLAYLKENRLFYQEPEA